MRDAGREAVFLDRDGVINVRLPDSRYVTHPGEFTFIEGVFEALRRLRDAGYLLIVVTNQRGVARGIMTEEDLAAVHAAMHTALAREGVVLDAVFYCPHERDAGCACRKPRPGMIEEACRQFAVDRPRSVIIGDALTDIEAGAAAAVRGILVTDGSTTGDAPDGIATAPSLRGAVDILLAQSRGRKGP